MSGKRLILASASPRRSELMREMGLEFEVIPSQFDEGKLYRSNPADLVMALARAKAEDVAARVENGVVVGADTIVVVDGQALGKPMDVADAKRMLRLLSGREHQVYSGIAVLDVSTGQCSACNSMTRVRFRRLSDETIERYVNTGEPIDKAGAYAIQGIGALLVSSIDGDYSTVVGMPIGLLAEMLESFGIEVL